MSDHRYDASRHAALICDWSLQVEPGDVVLVDCPPAAVDLGRALHRAVLERGAWPTIRLGVEGLARQLVDVAGDEQLDAPGPIELAELRAATKVVRILAPGGADELAGADAARMARVARGRTPLRRLTTRRRWCLTVVPTARLAEQAGMDEPDYTAFLTRALMLDKEDPAAGWGELSVRQAELCERLAKARTIRIEGPGTDLEVTVAGRSWQNSDGRRNLPSGEVFTGPHEGSARGVVRFDIPSRRPGGVVRGARLELRRGRVVRATAEEGQDILERELAIDDGAGRFGELGIGTNAGIDRPTGSTLLDEKIAGTVHLALGESYRETGGRNRSALHWDLICDLRRRGTLSADGVPLLEDGALR